LECFAVRNEEKEDVPRGMRFTKDKRRNYTMRF